MKSTAHHGKSTGEECFWMPYITVKAVNVKFPLSAPWRHTGELQVRLHSFVTSALNEIHASATLQPQERTPDSKKKGWVGHRAVLYVLENRKISFPGRNSNTSRQVRSYATMTPYSKGRIELYRLCFLFQNEIALLRTLARKPDIRLYSRFLQPSKHILKSSGTLEKATILSNWLSAAQLQVWTQTRNSPSCTSSFTKQIRVTAMPFTWHLLWTISPESFTMSLLPSPGGVREGTPTDSWSLAAVAQVQSQASHVGTDVN